MTELNKLYRELLQTLHLSKHDWEKTFFKTNGKALYLMNSLVINRS